MVHCQSVTFRKPTISGPSPPTGPIFFPSDLLDAELSINLVFMFRNMRSPQISDLRICDEFNLSAIEGADLLDALGIWHLSLEPPGA